MNDTMTADRTLNVQSVAAYADRVLARFDAADAVTLDLSDVEAPDVSVLQLVVSARLHAARTGKTLTLATPASGPLAAVLDRAGFLVDLSPTDRDFWFHGDLPK